MKLLPTYIQELDFEEWLARSKNIKRISDADIENFCKLLSEEENCDSFTTSPAYYALTGRRGLWLYHSAGTIVPFCWHPNRDGQILIFPPLGAKDYSAITALVHEAPAPPTGFLLARFKSDDILLLREASMRVPRFSYEMVEERLLDWRYPVRVVSTKTAFEMRGHEFMLVRNRIRQTEKYKVDVKSLAFEHVSDIENLSVRWANQHDESPQEITNLTSPYKRVMQLIKCRALKLDGLVFMVNGEIEAATVWDISNTQQKSANLFMNLCNTSFRGLTELAIKSTAERLRTAGVFFLNLGGSETAGLDRYKNKFVPVFSVDLFSLNVRQKAAVIPLQTLNNEDGVKVA